MYEVAFCFSSTVCLAEMGVLSKMKWKQEHVLFSRMLLQNMQLTSRHNGIRLFPS